MRLLFPVVTAVGKIGKERGNKGKRGRKFENLGASMQKKTKKKMALGTSVPKARAHPSLVYYGSDLAQFVKTP